MSEKVQNGGVATEVQWSELQRDPKSVAQLVDAAGDVRVRRRDGVALVLSREDRSTANETGALTAARALRNALVHLAPEASAAVLRDEFPWVDLLPSAERAEFTVDFVRAVQISAELGNWHALARTVTEWKATAAVHSDPGLLARLTAAVDEDFGPVPDPTDSC